jgi:hypothetical protein
MSSSSATSSTSTAALGAPSSTVFNGIKIVPDALHRVATHAVDAEAGTLPNALATQSLPWIADIKVLSRRDSVLLYLPNVAGAADFRAWVQDSSKVTYSGTQPRGAVVACAGYRRLGNNETALDTVPTRGLLQTLELPGLVADGDYTIVVEAISSPCPFTGIPGHTDATVTHPQNSFDYPNDNTYSTFRSFATVKNLYGNEIINGQGSLTSWANRLDKNFPLGLPVPPDSTSIPKDPVVIARSAIRLSLPAADETLNAPIFDVGNNSTFDDFSSDLLVDPATTVHNAEFSDPWTINPIAKIPGKWFFWGAAIQPVDGQSMRTTNQHGFQAFQRHGRLYTSFGDQWADVMASLSFSSLETLPQELDNTKYVHSFFRVNSDATPRRYWHWMICGDDAREKLVNTSTHEPTFRPIMDPFFFTPRGTDPNSLTGKNPSSRHGNEPTNAVNRYNKECLQIIQHGLGEQHVRNDGRVTSASRLVMALHPAGEPQGTIVLDSPGADWYGGGYAWRIDANGNYAGPMFEPFDQIAPLAHFDVFLRPDRLVFYINGRQAACVDMSARPLTMKYGLIMYGNLLYHSSAEQIEGEWSGIQDYHYRLNTPVADTRAWDAVGHSEKIDIPSPLSFDASLCHKPISMVMQ